MKNILLDFKTNDINHVYINRIYTFLNLLEDEYPHFDKWFFENVFCQNSSYLFDRKIIIKEYKKEICAVSILKPSEDKICTFRVSEKFQNLGIGTELMKDSIKILHNSKPLITVSENRIDEFHCLFRKFDFKIANIHQDYYLKSVKEFSYNRDIEDCNSEIFINI